MKSKPSTRLRHSMMNYSLHVTHQNSYYYITDYSYMSIESARSIDNGEYMEISVPMLLLQAIESFNLHSSK